MLGSKPLSVNRADVCSEVAAGSGGVHCDRFEPAAVRFRNREAEFAFASFMVPGLWQLCPQTVALPSPRNTRVMAQKTHPECGSVRPVERRRRAGTLWNPRIALRSLYAADGSSRPWYAPTHNLTPALIAGFCVPSGASAQRSDLRLPCADRMRGHRQPEHRARSAALVGSLREPAARLKRPCPLLRLHRAMLGGGEW
jgi:hypothetical protein